MPQARAGPQEEADQHPPGGLKNLLSGPECTVLAEEAALDHRSNNDGDKDTSECLAAKVVIKEFLKDKGNGRERPKF